MLAVALFTQSTPEAVGWVSSLVGGGTSAVCLWFAWQMMGRADKAERAKDAMVDRFVAEVVPAITRMVDVSNQMVAVATRLADRRATR